MRAALLPTLILVAATSAHPARANPEGGSWVNPSTGKVVTIVHYGDVAIYSITGNVDSALVRVDTPSADLCFDPDTGGTGGATRGTVYRLISPAIATIAASITLPPVPTDQTDCLALVNGWYWWETTTGPSGGEAPVVVITGRPD